MSTSLFTAERLLGAGQHEQAIATLLAYTRDHPQCQQGLVLQARAFGIAGCPEEARRDYRRARALGPDDPALRREERALTRELELRGAECRHLHRIGAFTVKRFLGIGWEGAAYHCRGDDGRHYIVKRFHPHRVTRLNRPVTWFGQSLPAASAHLLALSTALHARPHQALYRYSPLVDDAGLLYAVHYPFERLYPIRPQLLGEIAFGTRLLHAALSAQAYVLRHTGLVLVDLLPRQFMITGRGEPRFIDYGTTLLRPDDVRVCDAARHVVTLMRLMHDVVAPGRSAAFKRTLEAARGSRDALAAAFEVNDALYVSVERWPMLRPLHAHAVQGNFEAFVDADLYHTAAVRLPRAPVDWLTRREVLRGTLVRWRHTMATALHV